ncbi:MAG: transposase [Eubacterium sp.]|nr:transposase [Eubacterium sp.]
MGKQRKYTPEFKVQCVKDVLEGRKSIKQVANENDFRRSILQQWIKHFKEGGEEYFYEEHRGKGSGTGNPYAALHRKKNLSELERLELENLKLRVENERLKKGYMVKGVGANKEFVTFKDKNMKS